ncbi:Uncharacterised protein [Bordetella pertussis]|nr:Uncharacterised protein [Bordetella pertussis]
MRHALINEAMGDVVVSGLAGRRTAGDFGFLQLTFARIGEQVERIACAHDAGAGQRQRDAAGVDGDPAATPLFGDVSGSARAAGGVENQVTGVGGHQEAALNNRNAGLDDINLLATKLILTKRVSPNIRQFVCRVIIQVSDVAKIVPGTCLHSVAF